MLTCIHFRTLAHTGPFSGYGSGSRSRRSGLKACNVQQFQLNPDGAFVAAIIDEAQGPLLWPMDDETEVFFVNNFSGFALGAITTWDEPISGSVFKAPSEKTAFAIGKGAGLRYCTSYRELLGGPQTVDSGCTQFVA